MAIYEYEKDGLKELSVTSFKSAGIKEREDLQRLLRDQIDVIAPDTLVISEEFGEWEESSRRIDLLAIDSEANLVVIELKRTEDGGHMELQAIRYAAMVSTMTFERAVNVFRSYLDKRGIDQDPETTLIEFLEWENGNDEEFANDVRIILVSADFSRELTTAVMWLSERDIDIRCIRVKPYERAGQLLLDVQQIIPLPEAEEYQIQVKEKQQRDRKARSFNPDLTKYDVTVGEQKHEQLAKRHAIYAVVRFLHDRGVPPEKIADAVPKRKNRMFFSVDGDVPANNFAEAARQESARTGKAFSPKRYFDAEDELLKSNGKTYAFSNQWGSTTAECIDQLIKAFPEHPIAFSPAD